MTWPLTAPYAPIVPAKPFKGKSQAGDDGDFVVETDEVVGQVMAALEKKRMAQDTLLLFTSDNGPEAHAYERIRAFHHYSMGALCGVKRDTWEAGHREPEWFRKERHAQAPDDTGELFTLHDDPQETTNLYKTRPDIVAQLKQELEAMKGGRSGTAAAN